MIFKNNGEIRLNSLKVIGEGIIFANGGSLYLTGSKIPQFSKGVRFKNSGSIYLNDDTSPEFFIEKIRKEEILNCMIKQIYG